jgi:WD40 repeat protein
MEVKRKLTFYQTIAVPFEHPVTSLSISPLGREAVLAAKRGIYIINLEKLSPEGLKNRPARMLQHISKWDVTDVQWNPHVVKRSWIATTSNQKCLIWNLELESPSQKSNSNVEFVLSKHTRAISDLNWSPFKPETIATCSYDAYVHLWDLRQPPDRPSSSFCGWTSGATNVKFNKLNEHVLASSHDTDVRIWDIRKGSAPTTLITAHLTKIYGIDWSRLKEHELLTCSEDKLVKFWDIHQSRTPNHTIETKTPCYRARFTPFGNGVVTMPQRKDNNLYLWNRDIQNTPVYIFEGHKNLPTEFVWRYNQESAFTRSDIGDQQLVTWSKDMHLRLWPVGKKITKVIIVNKTLAIDEKGEYLSRGSLTEPRLVNQFKTNSESQLYQLQRTDSMASIDLPETDQTGLFIQSFERQDDYDLNAELDHLTNIFPGIYIDKSLLAERRCYIVAEKYGTNPVVFQLDIVFPKKYPSSPPFIDIQKTKMLSVTNRRVLKSKLANLCLTYSSKKIPSIESVIRFIVGPDINYSPITSLVPNSSTSGPSVMAFSVDSSSSNNDLLIQDETVPLSDPSSTDDEDFLDFNGHHSTKDSTKTQKDGFNIPYPRLCGASFSPSGQLIYFFCPMPHPKVTKFNAFSLTYKNQQRIVQKQQFDIQPRNYIIYENYRSFILAKCPRMFVGKAPQLFQLEELPINDKKLDSWFDEDLDDDQPLSIWTGNKSLTKPESFHTFDFLQKLNKATAGLNRNTSSTNLKDVKKLSLHKNPSWHKRPQSIYERGRESDEAANLSDQVDQPRSAPIEVKDSDLFYNAGNFRNPMKFNRATGNTFLIIEMTHVLTDANSLPFSLPSNSLPENTIHDVESLSLGTLVYSLDVNYLMPINEYLARNYM